MSGWGTVSQEPQKWSSNNFSSDQGFSSNGWETTTSEPQAQSSGWGSPPGGGNHSWQQMAQQMESTFIGNDSKQRDDAPKEGMSTSETYNKVMVCTSAATHTKKLSMISSQGLALVAILRLLKKVRSLSYYITLHTSQAWYSGVSSVTRNLQMLIF